MLSATLIPGKLLYGKSIGIIGIEISRQFDPGCIDRAEFITHTVSLPSGKFQVNRYLII